MRLSSLALTAAVSLSVLYVALALVAFTHVHKEKTTALTPKLLSLTFWWPFYDMYDEYGRKLSTYGKIILPIAIAAYVLWFIQPA